MRRKGLIRKQLVSHFLSFTFSFFFSFPETIDDFLSFTLTGIFVFLVVMHIRCENTTVFSGILDDRRL